MKMIFKNKARIVILVMAIFMINISIFAETDKVYTPEEVTKHIVKDKDTLYDLGLKYYTQKELDEGAHWIYIYEYSAQEGLINKEEQPILPYRGDAKVIIYETDEVLIPHFDRYDMNTTKNILAGYGYELKKDKYGVRYVGKDVIAKGKTADEESNITSVNQTNPIKVKDDGEDDDGVYTNIPIDIGIEEEDIVEVDEVDIRDGIEEEEVEKEEVEKEEVEKEEVEKEEVEEVEKVEVEEVEKVEVEEVEKVEVEEVEKVEVEEVEKVEVEEVRDSRGMEEKIVKEIEEEGKNVIYIHPNGDGKARSEDESKESPFWVGSYGSTANVYLANKAKEYESIKEDTEDIFEKYEIVLNEDMTVVVKDDEKKVFEGTIRERKDGTLDIRAKNGDVDIEFFYEGKGPSIAPSTMIKFNAKPVKINGNVYLVVSGYREGIFTLNNKPYWAGTYQVKSTIPEKVEDESKTLFDFAEIILNEDYTVDAKIDDSWKSGKIELKSDGTLDLIIKGEPVMNIYPQLIDDEISFTRKGILDTNIKFVKID